MKFIKFPKNKGVWLTLLPPSPYKRDKKIPIHNLHSINCLSKKIRCPICQLLEATKQIITIKKENKLNPK